MKNEKNGQNRMNMEPLMLPIAVVVVTIISLITTLITTGNMSREYFSLRQKELRNMAVDGCLKASLYRNVTVKSDKKDEENTITTEEPMEPAVKKCLELKGFNQ